MPAFPIRPGLLALIPAFAIARRAVTPARAARTAPPPQAEAPAAAAMHPILTMIDAARPDGVAPLATDPHAHRLETSARALTADYWPDSVWLTGRVSPEQLAAVTERLDAERAALTESIRLFVAPDTSTRPAPR